MTFDVILQQQGENNFIARPVLWPDSSVKGASQQDALSQVRLLIRDLLARTQLVQVEVDYPETEEENPWITTSGIFSDDPTWDDFIAEMAQYRQEVEEAPGN